MSAAAARTRNGTWPTAGFGLALLAALLLTACEDPMTPRACTAIAVFALNTTVLDDTTGQRLCDVTVTAIDGTFREELMVFPPVPECSYSGVAERAGRYQVQVTKAGYATSVTENIVVTADECHVIPVKLTVRLKKG